MMAKNFTISKKSLQGEDGHEVFSIRIKKETVAKIEEIVKETMRSRNNVIELMLEYAIDNYKSSDDDNIVFRVARVCDPYKLNIILIL